jgi:hypothetical protein
VVVGFLDSAGHAVRFAPLPVVQERVCGVLDFCVELSHNEF